MSRAAAVCAAALLLLASCGRDDTSTPGNTPSGTPPPTASVPSAPTAAPAPHAAPGDAEKGRQVYLGQCVACHNRDPGLDGPVGPAIKGSPRDLIEARVLRAEYPAGYKPKRDSKVMPARPDLAASVPDLAVFLR